MSLIHPASFPVNKSKLEQSVNPTNLSSSTHERLALESGSEIMIETFEPSSSIDGISSIVGGQAGFGKTAHQRSTGTSSTWEFGEQQRSYLFNTTNTSSTLSHSRLDSSATSHRYHTQYLPIATAGACESWQVASSHKNQIDERNQPRLSEQDHNRVLNGVESRQLSGGQEVVSNIPLPRSSLSTPNPPPHTATAAEIALGKPSSYNLHPFDEQQAMGTTPRDGNQHWASLQGNPKDEQIVENLSEVKQRDEENTSRTSETAGGSSPGRSTPMHDSSEHDATELPRQLMGTPSTVSTAPSTDDASLGTEYKLDDNLLPQLLHPGHRRIDSGSSWGEEGLLPGGVPMPRPRQTDLSNPWSQHIQPQQRAVWGAPQSQQQHQRVATFRQPSNTWTPAPVPGAQQYQPQQQGRPMGLEIRQSQGYQQLNQGYAPFQQQGRKAFGSSSQSSSLNRPMTPPRSIRGQRLPGQPASSHKPAPVTAAATSPHQAIPNPQRSSAEVLKTLLRKKACLFEPDTSRAVALVTWLVGRELAIEYGFFSRQQLQSGVHACVASKIEGGVITRTKVNRCMQIILNSCFHYIIPRADGTEEKGDYFREGFARSAKDDSFILRYLSRLWSDVTVDRDTVIHAALTDFEEKPLKSSKLSTPKSSPILTSAEAPRSPRDFVDHDGLESKRAVLLCFNENVRSAEDVFRCHNEFIRDTANAARLQLTANEWRTFFGRESGQGQFLLGKVGIPMSIQDTPAGPDTMGTMSAEEGGKFRTSWCAKRYDHDHELCGFAHVEVNGGWLRRNPMLYPYKDEMCGLVSKISDPRFGHFFLNECPNGLQCSMCHSSEELIYHPNRYKSKVCPSVYPNTPTCSMGDICSDFHPSDLNRFAKKTSEKPFGSRHMKKSETAPIVKSSAASPMGAPVLYASPAPFSSFERQLLMPGLQNLYRRQSSVVRAHVKSSGKCTCCYSCFGDDLGVSGGHKTPFKRQVGLPSIGRV